MSELRPFEECPRYAGCSVNICPLDPDPDLRVVHKLDKEQKCPMEKQVRLRIGSKYPALLPLQGLTTKEAAGAARWAALSESEKQDRKTKLAAARELLPKQKAKDSQ